MTFKRILFSPSPFVRAGKIKADQLDRPCNGPPKAVQNEKDDHKEELEEENALLTKKVRLLEAMLKNKNTTNDGPVENGCDEGVNDDNAAEGTGTPAGNLQLPALELAKSSEAESQYINWELMETKDKKIRTLKHQVKVYPLFSLCRGQT